MTIKVGDSIPAMTLVKATADGPAPVTTADLFGGRTVALFSVPGAFTPTCSAKHLPGLSKGRGAEGARASTRSSACR
jgi:glutaredoxin/glutathione-dependent peroxiredoxin